MKEEEGNEVMEDKDTDDLKWSISVEIRVSAEESVRG